MALVASLAVIAFVAGVAPRSAEAAKAGWHAGFAITEYYPAPEAWANGKRVEIPGAGGASGRIDWLYGSDGIVMEGDGVSVDGHRFHISGLGSQGWVQSNGKPTSSESGFSQGRPFWRDVGWRTKRGHVTYPLPGSNNWSAGLPRPRGPGSASRPLSFDGITFAPGPSRPLNYWRSVAVDPGVIPLGSKVYVPAYESMPGGGCFRADDTGSAINGKHLDVYRPPPSSPGGANSISGVEIYFVPAGTKIPKDAPKCMYKDFPAGEDGDYGAGATGAGAPSPSEAGQGARRSSGNGRGRSRDDGILTPQRLANLCTGEQCESRSPLQSLLVPFLVGLLAFLYG